MSGNINDKWINIDEAAAYLGVRPVTVRAWTEKIMEWLLTKLENSGNLR